MTSIIGAGIARIDGPAKVTGSAKYTSDYHFEGMLYAVPVCATIASGTIESIDIDAARAMPGVVEVFHRGTIGKLHPIPENGATIDEARPALGDDVVRYYGQYVAVVVAESFEEACAAVASVKVGYRPGKVRASADLRPAKKPKIESERGDPDAAFAAAAVTIDEVYRTPAETHNPIELHATVATWNGDRCTLYETTQDVMNHQAAMAQILGIPKSHVRIVSKFLGSGFGGKLWPWTHGSLAAAAARKLKRPVQLVISRRMMFQTVGHRPQTQQRVRLGATAGGKLTAFLHDYVNASSILDDYEENCGEATPYLYSTPNLRVTSGIDHRNIGTPTSMRGPGAVPGLFATESALDELAVRLQIDPVELRLRNEPRIDEGKGLPFSSRHFQECLTLGARRFGWAQRTPQVGSMRRDGSILGWGMAGCAWIADRVGAQATVEFRADGSVRVLCGTQDIGTGTYTVLAQIAGEATGVPVERIAVELGDSDLPPGPLSGGSFVTGSVIPAVMQAAREAIEELLKLASSHGASPLHGGIPKSLAYAEGKIGSKRGDGSPVAFADLLRAASLSHVAGKGKSGGTFGKGNRKVSTHSFGAQFAEITWQPEIARLRVSRVVSVIDGGRIINDRMARNQVEGSVVMGVGMAMLEQTRYDPNTGMPVNSNLADYMVATNRDAPKIDVTFLDYPDLELNELGARGVGEIGLAGVASAITAAVYHATGVRVRSLPVAIEDLL